jgi:D-methionine transport system permease protein
MSPPVISLLLSALFQTVLMVSISGAASFLLGLPLGVLLYLTRPGQILERPAFHRFLGLLINAGRSVPFIILMVALIPLTRFVVGTSIGTAAAIVPLSLGATPFVARLVEGALMEVPAGLVEAARAMGARPGQIVCKVLLPEALPGLLNAGTITLVTLVSYSAMAGVVGGGGLGDLGIRYGYQRFDATVMSAVVVILILLVQAIQFLGERLVRRVNHRA